MRISILIMLFTGLLSTVASAQKMSDMEQVKTILLRQASDWNRGDLDAFMIGYWPSEQLQFIGGNGVTYGYQNTLERYKRVYPNRSAMGQLHFDILEVHQLSKKVIMLTGKYTLTRENDMPTGHFLLVWKKIKGEWVIVADHSSSAS
ncbi:MAG: nuclear transport factor 2 family protein [Saprospiraceae bacterium]